MRSSSPRSFDPVDEIAQSRVRKRSQARPVRPSPPLAHPNSPSSRLHSTHGTIENILTQQTKFLPPSPSEYLTTIVAARLIFLNLPPLPPSFSLDSIPISPDLAELLKKWGISEGTEALRNHRVDEGPMVERISEFLEGREGEGVEEEEAEDFEGVERMLEERDVEAEAARDAALAERG